MTTPGRELEDRLLALGLSAAYSRTFGTRKDKSATRMTELERNFAGSAPILEYPGLSIFASGSYARGEASEYSDVDLFFVSNSVENIPVDNPRMREVKIMSEVINTTEVKMGFPPPSNDGEFLKILTTEEILKHLGGRDDDYRNHFTARMLMLLESVPVFNRAAYLQALESIIDSYLRDYEDHSEDFRPTFIVNDVIRFWKTLCLNYEHKRNQQIDAKKIKQKIRNFKLGYSRLLTCFATVALLSSYKQITKESLIEICSLSPIERLLALSDKEPKVRDNLKQALEQYHWFLEKTGSSTADLEAYFSNTNNRKEAFTHASKFGDAMYGIVHTAATEAATLRYLVV